MGSEKI